LTDSDHFDALWRLPTYLVWCLLFAVGMAPEEVYFLLREASGVTTQRALINSPHMITLTLSGFLGFFTYFRAREAGCSGMLARGKGLQVFCVGLVAFSNIPLAYLFHLDEIQITFYRNLLLGVAIVKFSAWLYALSTLSRYYFFSGSAVYADMPSLLPSTHAADPKPEPPAPRATAEEQD
jgi:hypothetical protein